MLLGCHTGQRLEPMGEMGRHMDVEILSFLDGFMELSVDALRKALLHHLVTEHILAEDIGDIEPFSRLTHTLFSFPVRNSARPGTPLSDRNAPSTFLLTVAWMAPAGRIREKGHSESIRNAPLPSVACTVHLYARICKHFFVFAQEGKNF